MDSAYPTIEKRLEVMGGKMERFVCALTLLVLLALAPISHAFAQQPYPNHPLRVVIPWPPGQAADLVGRVIAQKLAELLAQPAVPDNRAGAAGTIGTEYVAKAAPDGYTLLVASSGPITIYPLLQKTPYEVEREFLPVARVGLSPYVLVTGSAFPANNAKELVALLRASPGKYSFASSGSGSTAQIIAESFNMRAGITATHIPYKGSAP